MSIDTTVRITLRQEVAKHTENLVDRTDKALSFPMMAKLLGCAGYDEQKQDYFYERDGRRMYRKQKSPTKVMELAQLNNFLGVTLETDSPAAVENWVRYQMGRKETKQAWQTTGLGQQILADIQTIKSWAEQVALEVFSDKTPEHIQQAHIMLIRLYAGYLKRWFVARGGQE